MTVADKKKRRGFLSLFKHTKKTSVDVYQKYAPPALEAVNALPNGSVQKGELKTRLSVIFNEAKADTNPKKALKQVIIDAKAALKAIESQPVETTVSGPVQDETAEEMRRKVDNMYSFGQGAKMYQFHLDSVNPELDRLDAALGDLRNEIIKRDADLTGVVTTQDILVASFRSETKRALNRDLKGTAEELDARVKKDDITKKELADGLIGLKQSLDAHLDKVKQDVAGLIDGINDIVSQPSKLRDLAIEAKQNQDAEKLLQEYYAKVKEVGAALAQIEGWAVPEAKMLRAAFAEASGDSPKDPRAAMGGLDALLKEINDAAKAQTDDYNQEADKLKARLDAVQKKIGDLVLDIQFEANSDWEKGFRAQVKTEVEVINALMANGANKTALSGAEAMVASLEQRALDLEDNLREVIDLGEVQYQCKRSLKSKNNKKFCPELHEALSTEYEEVEKAALKKPASLAITDFNTMLGKLHTNSDSLDKLTEKRIVWLKQFKKSADKTEAAFAVLLKAMKSVVPDEAPGFFKTYVGPLADDLAQAREYAGMESEANMKAADDELKKIVTQIVNMSGALKKNAEDRTPEENQMCLDAMNGQTKGLDTIKKKKEDLLEFRRKYEAFMELHEELYFRYGFGSHIHKEFKAIEDMAKSSRDVMKSTEDLERSVKVLEAAENKMNRVIEEARLGRKKLAGIASTWNGALIKLDEGIAQIQAEALKKVTGHDDLEEAAGKIEKTLENATRFIDEHLFDDAEKTYANSSATAEQLKRTREETLNKIRLMKEFIANDPLIRAAQANPFGVKNVISPVFATLRDLEYKVLISA
ncbi:hypothetical protein DL239_02240 [Sedimentitalea sp. CY04]|uniref:Uncharacterized protein n=1 Tax=Parasedimentitalea denitrificans TaxID=2211118 RepID=A0ABX0W685_9RHOB|nr:hypothetical protein [Sedimentitalea sp. CY04]